MSEHVKGKQGHLYFLSICAYERYTLIIYRLSYIYYFTMCILYVLKLYSHIGNLWNSLAFCTWMNETIHRHQWMSITILFRSISSLKLGLSNSE